MRARWPWFRSLGPILTGAILIGSCSSEAPAASGSTNPAQSEVSSSATSGTITPPTSSTAPPTSSTTVGWVCADFDPLLDLGNAAIDGELEIVQQLVEKCIPDLAQSEYDDHAMARAGHLGSVAVFEYLLDAGADPTYVDTEGTSVLMWTARWLTTHQDTPPETAAAKAVIGRLLIERGVDVDHRGQGGNTALYWAVFAGHEELVRVLVEAGADVNATDDLGWTPLMVAAADGRVAIVQLLLDFGADSSLRDSQGLTASDQARNQGFEDIVELIEERLMAEDF